MPAYTQWEDRLPRAAGAHFGEGRAIDDDQGATAGTPDGIFHLLAVRLAGAEGHEAGAQ